MMFPLHGVWVLVSTQPLDFRKGHNSLTDAYSLFIGIDLACPSADANFLDIK